MNFRSEVKIMVFGTFDILHPGHLNFFKQARRLAENPFLVVSIARDQNVLKIKGHLPKFNEKQRLNMVKKCVEVDKVVLGAKKKYLFAIKKIRPDIIALGHDQVAFTEELEENLIKIGLSQIKIVRLKAFKRHKYRSSLYK